MYSLLLTKSTNLPSKWKAGWGDLIDYVNELYFVFNFSLLNLSLFMKFVFYEVKQT